MNLVFSSLFSQSFEKRFKRLLIYCHAKNMMYGEALDYIFLLHSHLIDNVMSTGNLFYLSKIVLKVEREVRFQTERSSEAICETCLGRGNFVKHKVVRGEESI